MSGIRTAIYLRDGDIINAITDEPIRDPALFIDWETSCVHGYGPKKGVFDKYNRVTDTYLKAGLPEMASTLMYLELNEMLLTVEQRCYILKRCAEFSATHFPAELCSKVQHSSPDDVIAWLNAEMARVPLDLTRKD